MSKVTSAPNALAKDRDPRRWEFGKSILSFSGTSRGTIYVLSHLNLSKIEIFFSSIIQGTPRLRGYDSLRITWLVTEADASSSLSDSRCQAHLCYSRHASLAYYPNSQSIHISSPYNFVY